SAAQKYRERCVACHASVTVAGHPASDGADCASCHMPRRRTEDAVHVIMTDHLIAREPSVHDPAKPIAEHEDTYRGPLVIYYPQSLSPKEREVYLGIALINGSADRRGGIALLEKGVASGD